MRKLVILGLPWDTTEASLEQYFSQIGPLQVCHRPCGWYQHRHSIWRASAWGYTGLYSRAYAAAVPQILVQLQRMPFLYSSASPQAPPKLHSQLGTS